MKIYINGSFVNESEEVISVNDRSFLYGDAVFETFRSYDGNIPFFHRHMKRLKESLCALRINFKVRENKILSDICALLKVNKLRDAVIRVAVSRGKSQRAVTVTGKESPAVIITASDKRFYPRKMYQKGIKLSVLSVRRIPSQCIPSHIKSANYLNQVLARIEAVEKGADDGLMKNVRGFVSETSSANIFFVRNGMIFTPSKDCDILEGITRGIVMEIAREEGIAIKEGKYYLKNLENSEECFVTNSVAEIIPVAEINNYKVGSGFPGALTRRMHKKYRQRVSGC